MFWNDGSLREQTGPALQGHTGGLPGTATTARRFSDGVGVVGDVQMVAFFNKATGHELVPMGVGLNCQYQSLYTLLLGAYAAAEARLPA